LIIGSVAVVVLLTSDFDAEVVPALLYHSWFAAMVTSLRKKLISLTNVCKEAIASYLNECWDLSKLAE
jgi:hypothetical protein